MPAAPTIPRGRKGRRPPRQILYSISPLLVFLGLQQSSLTRLATLQTTDALATPVRRSGRRRPYPQHQQQQQEQPPLPRSGNGFARTESDDELDDLTSSTLGSSDNTETDVVRNIYSLPALYDLAFGYRNYEEEVEFLVHQHQKLHGDRLPHRILELAAGPARHSLALLDGGIGAFVTALDNAPAMRDYGLELAATELDVESQKYLDYHLGDMADFDLTGDNLDKEAPQRRLYDSAWLLLGSLQHLTTNDKVLDCFRCVHKHLAVGGTFILELPHPRELFNLVECTRNGWEIPLEDDKGVTSGELKIVWGDDDDVFDPVTQVRHFTVSMELTELDGCEGEGDVTEQPRSGDKKLQSVKEVVPMRHFTAQEIDMLARHSGFHVTSMYGALAEDVDLRDEDEAFRLVCVLQKQ